MARRIGRSPFWQEAIGFLLAKYLRFVQITSRFTTVPEDLDEAVGGQTPVICAMWHGQHLMMTFAWPAAIDRMAALISRHEDAGAQAIALEHLGVTPVRGSGGPADRVYYKGGVPAMRELLRQLRVGRLGGADRRRAEDARASAASASWRWRNCPAGRSCRPRW